MYERTPYAAHRLAWFYETGEWPSDEIDHKNRGRDDNWFENLREATRSQNVANTALRSTNTSGFKGVSFDRSRGRFLSKIKVNYRTINLGRFDAPEEAHAAYLAAAQKHFGEFACRG